MSSPIDALLEVVPWTENAPPEGLEPGDKYATHSGVLSIGGIDLRVYRLNTGEAIINADDFNRFFGGVLTGAENIPSAEDQP